MKLFFVGMIMTIISSVQASEYKLPDYVVTNSAASIPAVLSTVAKDVTFPLSSEDQRDIKILERKFDLEKNCAGLAAPQIGISKKIIVFAAPDNVPELKKWRPDFTQTMPKTIWINPTYKGIEKEGYHEDYEGCFSVEDLAGAVDRYKKIHYQAYDIHGNLVTGTAEGYLARVIQHEVDHVHGILFINRATPGKLLPIDEYRKRREEAMKSAK